MKRVVWIALAAVGILSLSGCFYWTSSGQPFKIAQALAAGPVERKTIEVQKDDAERVQATVRFGGGELNVEPGSDALLRGQFVYNLDSLEPEISYDVQDRQGTLLIEHRADRIGPDQVRRSIRGELRNEWTLFLAQDIPLDLQLDVGASSGEIELGGLAIENLDLTTGAADLRIGFDKPNPERLSTLHIHSGAAKIELYGLGNANLDELAFDGGLGTYLFDLSGEWQRSANVRILAGASQVTLRLPQEIGVRVCPGDLYGEQMNELEERDGCYVNGLYDRSDIVLDIALDLGLGKLDVKQVY
jgi:hypothetical protein